MRHRNSGSKLGRNPSHRRATLRNLVTTCSSMVGSPPPDAREATRPVAEKIITLGSATRCKSRRQAAAYLMTPAVTAKLSAKSRQIRRPRGGYTRIIHAHRVADGAKVAISRNRRLRLKEKRKERKNQEEEPAAAAS